MMDKMDENAMKKQYELTVFIVPIGIGSKIVSLIRKLNISGGTITLAKGTSNDKLLKLLQLDENHKELVFVASNQDKSEDMMRAASEKFHFEKPNKGICFSMPLNQIYASKVFKETKTEQKETNTMMNQYKAIYAIVNLGEGEAVVSAASEAGAKGGTIIHGRGAGVHETSKIFAIEIEPEKEIVLILVKESIVDKVTQAILTSTKIDQTNQGIMFTHDVSKAFGLVE